VQIYFALFGGARLPRQDKQAKPAPNSANHTPTFQLRDGERVKIMHFAPFPGGAKPAKRLAGRWNLHSACRSSICSVG
jgi:hypothetical protein